MNPMQRLPQTIQWRSWGEEAFREARDLSRPIFLSISAVWCHWCHVMDEEGLSHPEVIRRLNGEFIPVRVDSDKRPDINNRYNMGGWPTVVILDPEGLPLAGDTYMPTGQLLMMLSSVKERLQQKTGPLRDRPSGEPPPVLLPLDWTARWWKPYPTFWNALLTSLSEGLAVPPSFHNPGPSNFSCNNISNSGMKSF